MVQHSLVTESDILADVIAADAGDLSPEVAREVLGWRFSDRASRHMSQLADRSNKGVITDSEAALLERYLRVGSLVNLLQAKARLSLKAAEDGES